MIIRAQEIGRVPGDGQPALLGWPHEAWLSGGSPHIAVRTDAELQIFALESDRGERRRVATFPAPWPRWELAQDAVAHDLSFAVFSGCRAVRATDRQGPDQMGKRRCPG